MLGSGSALVALLLPPPHPPWPTLQGPNHTQSSLEDPADDSSQSCGLPSFTARVGQSALAISGSHRSLRPVSFLAVPVKLMPERSLPITRPVNWGNPLTGQALISARGPGWAGSDESLTAAPPLSRPKARGQTGQDRGAPALTGGPFPLPCKELQMNLPRLGKGAAKQPGQVTVSQGAGGEVRAAHMDSLIETLM